MNYIVANWKSNKTLAEAQQWLKVFQQLYRPQPTLEVILCPSYLHLATLAQLIQQQDLQLKLGVQDISPFPAGAYTGEVAAAQLTGLIEYAIIGHSERRNYFHEDDQLLAQKVTQTLTCRLQPLYCIQQAATTIPPSVKIIAYEPPSAIGTGHTANPTSTNQLLAELRQQHQQLKACLYGGSVTPQNVASFLVQPNIDGVLVGGASLDPESFAQIITHATQVQT